MCNQKVQIVLQAPGEKHMVIFKSEKGETIG